MAPLPTALGELQQSIAAAIRNGGRILQLTDQAVAETLIRDYFRAGETGQARHLVDVGAAYGSVAGVFLNDGWTADLFEPDPACAPPLQRLLAKHGTRARLHTLAVGSRAQAAVFYQNTIPGLSGLQPSPFGSARSELPIKTVRLDDYLPSIGVKAVDLLKIDTEGNDFDVLDSHDFSALAPALVYVEYSYYFAGQTPAVVDAAIADMRARGYDAVIFEYRDDGNFRRGSWAHRLVAIRLDDETPSAADAFGNVLFYRHGDPLLLKTLARTVAALH